MIMGIDQTVINWRKDPVLGIRRRRRGDRRELFAYVSCQQSLSPSVRPVRTDNIVGEVIKVLNVHKSPVI
jgi:hypothetical protein